MTDRITLTLYNAQQGHTELLRAWTWCKAMMMAGHRLTLTVDIESKTRKQEKLYHDMIADASRQAQHLGSKWGKEDWKRLLIDKFARETGRTHGKIIPNLDSDGVVEVGILSRNFSISDAQEFIDWLDAWGAMNGVTFEKLRHVDPETGEIYSASPIHA